jgi:FkbM family methyltransferase
MSCSRIVHNENVFTIHYLHEKSFEETREEVFDNEEYIFKSESVPEAPFILDCGSNIGISILYFKSKYPGSRILGFEPVPECFAILTKNIEQNDLENVQVTNAALSDSDGQVCLFVGADHDLRGASINRSWGGQTTEDHIFVKSVRLSKYINGRVDFLKLDIEGAEEIVIPEIRNKLPFVKELYIEYHETRGRSFLEPILSILEKYYSAIEVEEKPLKPFLAPDRLEWWERESPVLKTVRAYNRHQRP